MMGLTLGWTLSFAVWVAVVWFGIGLAIKLAVKLVDLAFRTGILVYRPTPTPPNPKKES